jgi:transcriptional repressor NrdR
MKCPKCGHKEDKVLDSRAAREGAVIRRRRECLKCGQRFTTYEEIYRETFRIIKRDGRREEFDRRKLASGIEKACEKRPVSAEQIDAMVSDIVAELENQRERELPSSILGEMVIKRLRKVDEVAYVRFASVYRQFKDVNEFINEIKRLSKKSR